MPVPDTLPYSSPFQIRYLATLRFFWILVLLVLFITLVSENPKSPNGRIDGAVVFLGIITAVMFAVRARRRRFLFALFLNLIPFALWVFFILHHSSHAEFFCFLAVLVCLLYTISCTLEFVLVAGAVSAEHIIGAICAYVMIAMFFATIYTLCFVNDPAAFSGLQPTSTRPWSDLLYFSFCTLSTVGYGDIAPALPLARSFSMLEQLTGTFYLAILIARLTGLYPPRGRRNDPPSP